MPQRLQLFVVTAIVIVVAIRVAKPPGGFIVWVARQNMARGGLRDQPISVLLAEEPRTTFRWAAFRTTQLYPSWNFPGTDHRRLAGRAQGYARAHSPGTS